MHTKQMVHRENENRGEATWSIPPKLVSGISRRKQVLSWRPFLVCQVQKTTNSSKLQSAQIVNYCAIHGAIQSSRRIDAFEVPERFIGARTASCKEMARKSRQVQTRLTRWVVAHHLVFSRIFPPNKILSDWWDNFCPIWIHFLEAQTGNCCPTRSSLEEVIWTNRTVVYQLVRIRSRLLFFLLRLSRPTPIERKWSSNRLM